LWGSQTFCHEIQNLQPTAGARRRQVAAKKASGRNKANRRARPAGRDNTKMAKVIALLQQPEGATLQAHRAQDRMANSQCYEVSSVPYPAREERSALRRFHSKVLGPVKEEVGPEGSVLPARRRACLLHQTLTRRPVPAGVGGRAATRPALAVMAPNCDLTAAA
jgi:hypothetical protein